MDGLVGEKSFSTPYFPTYSRNSKQARFSGDIIFPGSSITRGWVSSPVKSSMELHDAAQSAQTGTSRHERITGRVICLSLIQSYILAGSRAVRCAERH